jgi:hypothetical protein
MQWVAAAAEIPANAGVTVAGVQDPPEIVHFTVNRLDTEHARESGHWWYLMRVTSISGCTAQWLC